LKEREIREKAEGKGKPEVGFFFRDKGEKTKAYMGKRRTETGGHCTEKKKDRSSPPGHHRCASSPPPQQQRHSATINAANASGTREGEEEQNRER
jgi:hypothetical protein